jgi:beta-galactosidase/beta-glucuronidase
MKPALLNKNYSGTAVYQTTFVAGPVATNQTWLLDFGQVEVMTEVKLNGKNLGILWKTPCRVDVTSALPPGENHLELKAVNLWINRQIGDENLPEDSERNAAGTLKSWLESQSGFPQHSCRRLCSKAVTRPVRDKGIVSPSRPLHCGRVLSMTIAR